MLSAAEAGKSLPNVGPVSAKALAAQREDAETRRYLAAAREQAAGALRDLVIENGETIIVESLRPALDRIITAARADARKFEHLGETPDPMLVLNERDEEVQAAYVAIREHHAHYSAVLNARGALARLGVRASLDEQGIFGSIKNPEDYYPVDRYGSKPLRPWPDDPRGGFVWLLLHNAEFWMPTPEEQDVRWREIRGEAFDRAQRGRHQLMASQAAFGG